MFSLRLATVNDSILLSDFRIEFLKEIQTIPKGLDLDTFRITLSEYFRENLANNTFYAWLAESNGEVIATSGLTINQKPPHFVNSTGKEAYIMNMYTKPNWRKKGLGTALFEKLLEEVNKLGITKVVLHTTSMGKPLYEKFGFRSSDDEMVLYL
ncbi:MAG: GNAT family N-acetyltransferase [Candidatus Heimdallarchaeota archaeon]|nr:GNAT family N-acetyltransferase [Candidatus Heimdallarchaeota archaeon]